MNTIFNESKTITIKPSLSNSTDLGEWILHKCEVSMH